jgi:DNA polymerase V
MKGNDSNSGKGVSEHSGFPNPATDTSLTGLSLDQLLVARPVSTYFMRIKGDEWQEQGIFDGDIAIVDRALEPKKHDYIVWVKDDALVISQKANAPDGATLWGVVTAVIHLFRKK